MYEPEVMEFTTACGQVQGLPGRPALELNSGEGSLKSENIISPAVEGMTFQDYVDPEVLLSPTVDEMVFSGCLPKGQNSTISTPGMGLIFEDGIKQELSLYGSDKGLVFIDSEKLQEASSTSLDDVSYKSDQKVYGSFGSFDMLSSDLSLDDHERMDPLMPAALEVTDLNEEDIRNDWFELDKDIYEMSKDTDILLHDPVFSGGPTLTQLNSRDLDSTCLDYNSLKDLYADTFPLDKLHASMPSTDNDLAKMRYKYPVGISGATSTAAAPKVTTCTVTSFVTSLSTSGAVLPQCPDFTADELSASQEFCYLGSDIQDTKQKLSVQNQWGSLFATKPAMTQFKTSPCLVPLLRNKSQQMDSLIGTIVVTGGGDVSLVVSGEAARSALQSLDKSDFPEENWEEIENLLCDQNKQTDLTAQNVNSNKSQPSIKLEIQDVNFNVQEEEVTDKESVFDDSDLENADVDYSEDSIGKSDKLNYFSTSSHKEKKYFWQYNTQSKGPKGKRLCKSVETEDPHVLHDFEDPVFDPEQNQTRYKHNGKARRGDGNDVTPNPYRLYVTGNELKKLNNLINGMTPSSDMPANVRAKLLKEKNKYASRACRLKKKAQHEANKLKLHGLELEHRQLMKILGTIKKEIMNRVCHHNDLAPENLSSKLEMLISKHLSPNVAGRTSDYVNSVLQKVAKGDRTGGITLDD